MKKLSSPLPISPLPPDGLVQAEGGGGKTANSPLSTRLGLQLLHPTSHSGTQSKRAAPLTASDLKQPKSESVGCAKCWEVSKGSNCRWKNRQILLRPSRNTHERAACASIWNRQPIRNVLKHSFQREKLL